MSPLVTVVVVNWNGLSLLRRCLPPVLAQRGVPYEVIVVDNGSSDGSLDWLRRLSATLAAAPAAPPVRILASERNLGFAAGNNLAIRESQAPFVATLNNDARPEPGWLAALVAAAEADPKIGSCAAQLVFASRPEVVNSAGIALDRAGIAWDREVGAARHPPGPATEVFGASAGAALYRRAMLDDVGLFAESFFMYLEDVDLAWRARLRQWQCVYVPAAVVHHLHSASAGEGSPFKLWHLGATSSPCWPAVCLTAPCCGMAARSSATTSRRRSWRCLLVKIAAACAVVGPRCAVVGSCSPSGGGFSAGAPQTGTT